MRWFSLIVFSLLALAAEHSSAGEKDKKEKNDDKKPYLLVVPPTGGKEVKLVDWRFVVGTRHLDLTSDKPRKNSGPEYLEFREDNSTTFQDGILTLVPLTTIRKITYDRDKKTVALVVLKDGDKEVKLNGTTKFKGINKITLEAEALLDGLGAATVKFQGGADKGLQSITFPSTKSAVEAKGTGASIVAVDKEKTKHAAFDLQPLYYIDGGYRVLPYLMFKKTVKIDIDKLAAMRFVPSEDKKKISYDFEVTLKDGNKHTLTMLTKIDLEAKKSATLEGLIGRVPVGYKLFPAHTIQELRIGEDEKEIATPV